ncbi:MAG: hypothetical protein NTZ74_01115 [Chloroflexi bacterium]|nr:hypothetical protein [Chloroflexota bacterium]
MSSQKKFWSSRYATILGTVIVVLTGMVVVFIFLEEALEEGGRVPMLFLNGFSQSKMPQPGAGDEFSGGAAAWLFGISVVPILIKLLLRVIVQNIPLKETGKKFLEKFNWIQRKFLLPLHTPTSLMALGFGILHLRLSNCPNNPFPELGLLLSFILVMSGLLFKWKGIPLLFRQKAYQFHASLIASGVLLILLLTGHFIMDLD